MKGDTTSPINPKRPRLVLALERRKNVLELRKKGYNYREIATELGIGLGTVQYHMGKIIEQMNKTIANDYGLMKHIQNMRLEELLKAHYVKATEGDRDAGEMVLKVLDRIAKLHNLNPEKTMVIVPTRYDQMSDDEVFAEALKRGVDVKVLPPHNGPEVVIKNAPMDEVPIDLARVDAST